MLQHRLGRRFPGNDMARELEDIFNECYERILQGESFESCLARYPEYAAQLEPLLRTAFGFTLRVSTFQPRPEFKHWLRVRLQGAQFRPKQREPMQKPGFFSWQRAWAVGLTAILVVLLAGGSTAAASADAMPDNPLYPVKLATEQVKLAFTFSDTSKAELHAQLAETRVREIEAMANQGKTGQVAIAAERLANQLEQANNVIARVETVKADVAPSMLAPEKMPPPTPPAATIREAARAEKTEQVRESLQESASKSLSTLQSVLEQAPPQAKPALQRAIDRISERGPKRPQDGPGIQKEDGDREGEGYKDWQKDETRPAQPKPGESQSSESIAETKKNAVPPSVIPEQQRPVSISDNSTRHGADTVPLLPDRPQPALKTPESKRNTSVTR